MSVAPSTTRTEVAGSVTMTAVVTDAETPAASLTYQWTATGGAFTGTGPAVTWNPPSGEPTPTNYSLTLTVVEPYQALNASGQIVTLEHRVTSAPVSVRVHNSPVEMTDVAVRFLEDFANSSVSAAEAVAEFSDACSGKADEFADVTDNRLYLDIVSSTLTPVSSAVLSAFQGGEVRVQCSFTSVWTQCPPADHRWNSFCSAPGQVDTVAGTCRLTTVYENQQWRLCSSLYDPAPTLAPFGKPVFDFDLR